MVSPRIGWALRYNQYDNLTAVLRTVDGGRRWADVTPPRTADAGAVLTARSPARAWLAVEQLRTHRSTVSVWRTADGGKRWTGGAPVRAGSTGSLQFVDRNRGWLTLNDGAAAGSTALRVFATLNGGRRWRLRMRTSGSPGYTTRRSLPFGCDKDTTSFATARRGFAGAFCAGGEPFLYASEDGGRTWHRHALTGLPENCECDVETPVFFSATGGYLTAGTPGRDQRTYLTNDSGRTWRELPVQAAATGEISFVDARDGWVTTSPAAISHTRDGGRRWTVLPTPFDASQATIEFVSQRAGFAVENSPHADRIWSTRDGGRHWRPAVARLE
jgi:photosystem II stability/assembly factor-like uncharacterized protein